MLGRTIENEKLFQSSRKQNYNSKKQIDDSWKSIKLNKNVSNSIKLNQSTEINVNSKTMKENQLLKEFAIQHWEYTAPQSLNNTLVSNKLKARIGDSKLSKRSKKNSEARPNLPRWVINVEDTKKSTKISSVSRSFLNEYK